MSSTAAPSVTRAEVMSKLFGYIRGLHATYLMELGVRLKLFETLRQTCLTPDQLAGRLALDPFYVTKWCETAYSLDLLEWDEGRGYSLAPFIDDLLANPDHTYYMGGFPDIHLRVAEDYAGYPERFKDGRTKPYQAHEEPFFSTIAQGLKTLPRMLLDTTLPQLPALAEKLEAGGRLLDVGCGGGAAICEFAERYPRLTCTGIDVEPASLRLAEEEVRRRGLQARIRVEHVPEDAPYAADFDVATMLLVFHELNPRLKPDVLRRVNAALKPGGVLLILDEAYPDTVAGLRDPTVAFSVMAQWFEMTWGNVVNTKSEIRGMLDEAGFEIKAETNLSRFYIVAAEKR